MFSIAPKTLTAAALIAGTLVAGSVGTTTSAQAFGFHGGHGWHGGHGFHGGFGHRGWGRRWGGPVALGLVGAAAYGAYAYRGCYLQRQFDDFGNYIGRVRVCN